ncbi:CHAT domain-containing protein [Mycena leptocephala]|nr:CHAT domain-containing protein [Mycena leptocephala]
MGAQEAIWIACHLVLEISKSAASHSSAISCSSSSVGHGYGFGSGSSDPDPNPGKPAPAPAGSRVSTGCGSKVIRALGTHRQAPRYSLGHYCPVTTTCNCLSAGFSGIFPQNMLEIYIWGVPVKTRELAGLTGLQPVTRTQPTRPAVPQVLPEPAPNTILKYCQEFESKLSMSPQGHKNFPCHFNASRTSHATSMRQELPMRPRCIKNTHSPSWNQVGAGSRLNNLGVSLSRRFEQLGDLSDINKSVLMFEDAVQLTPNGHPDKPGRLMNLGNSLSFRFEQLGDPQDSQQLLLHYTSAACSTTGPASIRFKAARRWATHAQVHQPSSLLCAYTTAIELLPELAWLGLSITDRHHHLSQVGRVVRDAASAAIAVHDYQKAVEWLDQGRSVIWGQLLNLRTPVDKLREHHPGLADELVSLSILLETAGVRGNSVVDGIKPQSPESIAQRSHAHTLRRNHVLQQIRELSGFERFLLSKPISELSQAAKMGPVAILNISAYGCDALILMPGLADEVIHVLLSDFTIHESQTLAKSLASIVGTPGRNDRLHGSIEGAMAPDDIFSHILSEIWFKIVRPILNVLAFTTPVSQDLGRIWWCPTGPLAFLPIHAAGLYSKDQAFGSKLSDFLISSYTPSLSALIQGYRPQSESQARLQLLAVSQPSAEGQSYIPGTHEEIKAIEHHAMGKVPVLRLDRHMATIEEVQKGMKESRWVHFACHGVQSTSPTESALLLAGSSQLTLSNIIQLSLPNADLAFLSACQTATGSQQLQDESVHLAAGMLLAGY